VSLTAAGIGAASMGRRCLALAKTGHLYLDPRQGATSEGRWGTLSGEVKEGICPKGKGGTRAGKSPPPAPAQAKPAWKCVPAQLTPAWKCVPAQLKPATSGSSSQETAPPTPTIPEQTKPE